MDVTLTSEAEDIRLSEAIDSFLAMQQSGGWSDAFDLDLMVRTALGPGGERLKQIVFQHHDLADAFSAFWTGFRAIG
jgi:hypothetical protein